MSATNFTLRATNSTIGETLVCSGPTRFEFRRSSVVTISGITFVYCGASLILHEYDSYLADQIEFTLLMLHSQV